MGLSLASVFAVYTGVSIARVFFISAATFGAMSLYGYTTQRNLAQFGSFLFMGLIGIIIASLVNLFVGSTALQFAVSVIGVLIFAGLTAWDTQRLKDGAVTAGQLVDGGVVEPPPQVILKAECCRMGLRSRRDPLIGCRKLHRQPSSVPKAQSHQRSCRRSMRRTRREIGASDMEQ